MAASGAVHFRLPARKGFQVIFFAEDLRILVVVEVRESGKIMMQGAHRGGRLTSSSLVLSLLCCVSLALGKGGPLEGTVASGKYRPLQQSLSDLQQAQKETDETERELAKVQDASEREIANALQTNKREVANAQKATTECELRARAGQALSVERKSAKRLGVMEEQMARLMKKPQSSMAPALRECQSSLAKLQMQHTAEGRDPSSVLNLHRLLSPQGLCLLLILAIILSTSH